MPVDRANESYSSVRLGAAASVVNFIVALAIHHVFTQILPLHTDRQLLHTHIQVLLPIAASHVSL